LICLYLQNKNDSGRTENAYHNSIYHTIFFLIIIGLYFLNLLKSQQCNRSAIDKESKKELDKLRKLKEIKLYGTLVGKNKTHIAEGNCGAKSGNQGTEGSLVRSKPSTCDYLRPSGGW